MWIMLVEWEPNGLGRGVSWMVFLPVHAVLAGLLTGRCRGAGWAGWARRFFWLVGFANRP